MIKNLQLTKKADLFGSIIGEIFKDNEDEKFDKNFKIKIETEVKDYLDDKVKDKNVQQDLINFNNLRKIIKSFKTTLSSGEDKISNIMLKNLGDNFLQVLVHLFNTSIQNSETPQRWKKGIVKMIPKKQDSRENPNNYRPITLTNCLARLCERVILIAINKHLINNKIIVKKQSGFRAHRQTKDNLFFLCQKNIEAFNRKMKNCVIFFDISKSFDKVWHKGLLFKMMNHKFDKYIINCLMNFIKREISKLK